MECLRDCAKQFYELQGRCMNITTVLFFLDTCFYTAVLEHQTLRQIRLLLRSDLGCCYCKYKRESSLKWTCASVRTPRHIAVITKAQ